MDKHVFISYQHDDGEFAENLIHAVEKNGFKTWIDSDRLNPGEDWREGIDQAIRNSFALIVIMSPTAKASEYVTYEWAFAWGCGLKVIPIMYRKTELHPRLESLQYMDFTNRSLRPWDRLMKVLKAAASKVADSSKALEMVVNSPSPFPIPAVPLVSTAQKVQEWLDKGNMFFERRDYDGALDAFKQAIQLDPNNVGAYTGKSTALYELKRYKEALVASEQALRLDPHHAPAWNAKGDAFDGFERREDSLIAFEQAIHLDPEYTLAWKNKGVELNLLERYEDALLAYEQAIRLDPEYASSWNGKGCALNAMKRYAEALTAFEQALKLDPEYAGAWNGKGAALSWLDCYEEALTAYEQALRLDPEYGQAWNNKGLALNSLGRSQEAEQCFKKARELGYKDEEED